MRDPIEASKMLNSSNDLYKGNPDNVLNTSEGSFNCWGYVSYMANWTNNLFWVPRFMMEDLLNAHSFHIDRLCVGAIVVMRDNTFPEFLDDALTHTALVFDFDEKGEPLIVHKPGNMPMEVMPLSEMKEQYTILGKVTEYRYPL